MLETLRGKKILVVVAHPDDELLGLGATMNRLIKEFDCRVRVIILGEGWRTHVAVRAAIAYAFDNPCIVPVSQEQTIGRYIAIRPDN